MNRLTVIDGEIYLRGLPVGITEVSVRCNTSDEYRAVFDFIAEEPKTFCAVDCVIIYDAKNLIISVIRDRYLDAEHNARTFRDIMRRMRFNPFDSHY